MVLASKLGNLCRAHPLRQNRDYTANLPISNIGVYKATETYHANTTPWLVLDFNPSEKYESVGNIIPQYTVKLKHGSKPPIRLWHMNTYEISDISRHIFFFVQCYSSSTVDIWTSDVSGKKKNPPQLCSSALPSVGPDTRNMCSARKGSSDSPRTP